MCGKFHRHDVSHNSWEPVGGVLENLGRMLLQGGQVFKWVYFLQVAGVNQAHEQVADISSVLGFVE